jgi:cyclopropane fatty-acyl-phospholipid synthase-like methyltransferase
MPEDARRHAPATLRNRDAILAVLRRHLPAAGLLLEVASGTGEHAVHVAAALPGITVQPSDPDAGARASIDAHAAASGLPNLRAALALDVAGDWPIAQADAALCCNMIHIAPWEATPALLAGAARVLPPGAPLLLYGPFRQGGRHTAPSNAAFDDSLRARDPRWGVRDLEAVIEAAAGFDLATIEAMPANNLTAVFRRRG